MKRSLARLAAVFPVIWVGSAAALGLGEIDASSRLNQRFAATIPLYETSAGELGSLRVGLANTAEFTKAGLERPAYLSTLRFEVKTDGAPRIVISSDQPAREPVMTLLLEVIDGGSRVVREYTVLLDPPDYRGPADDSDQFYETAAEAARRAQPSAQAAAPMPAPMPAPTPAPTVAPAPASTPVAVDEPAQSTDWEASRAAPVSQGGGESSSYGPIAAQETLWSVATRLRPQDATMDQVLLALYTANPQAFDRGSFNGLLRGAVLTVPSLESMLAVDPATARTEIMRLRGQTRAPQRAAATVPAVQPTPEPVAVPTPDPTPAPTPEAIVEPTPAVDVLIEESPAAELPAADNEAVPDATPGLEDPSVSPEIAADTPPEATPVPELGADEEEVVAEETLASRQPRESGLLETLLLPLILGLLLLGAIGYGVSRVLARRKSDAAAAAAVKPSTLGKAAVAGAGLAAARRDTREDLEKLQDDIADEDRTAPDLLATTAFEVPPSSDDTAATAQFSTQQFDTSAFDTPAAAEEKKDVDFDLTGQFAAQTVQINLDANDPLSEADFHLAYGLYDEAALLLRQASEREPERQDLRIKLAETYFAAGKPIEFQECAEALKSSVSPAEWQKIAIMGQQIAPDVDLFRDAADGGDVAAAEVDLDLGDDEPLAPVEHKADAVDFKLDSFDLPKLDDTPIEISSVDKGEALEFDLSEFDLASPGATELPPLAEPAPAPQKNAQGSVDFDFDLSGFDVGDAAPATAASPSFADSEPRLDFSLETEPVAPNQGVSVGDLRLDDIDLGDVPAEAGGLGADEAATKLDLARAYVDMGDVEMARSLLDEVLAQGNEQQKGDARALIDQLV